MLSLAKAHAYGNDFLFIPHDQAEGRDPHALARQTCARQTGIGGDGLILYTLAPDGTARMTLYNADGSPSELSGNGLRCLAALALHRRGPTRGDVTQVHIETGAGWKLLTLIGRAASRYTFRAAMGQPTDIRQETLDVAGESLQVTTLGMGNPQCVTLVEELPDDARFQRLGRALSTHARFAAGTNVEFARIEAPDRVRILIWERGVGPTRASGTGACASAVAAATHGGAAHDVEVIAPGGTQRVEWRDEGVYLTGWAEVIFEGHWIPDGGFSPITF
ncbi:MAG TPA: diaminopimelate epimerase [Vicinamibacterales bacterium]|nr:diaminopimelate epimerase [Vicinamibacterales bacterium]